jgi:trigger factor
MDSGSMQVSVTTTHGLERRLEIAVPGERLAGEVDQRLKRLTRTVRVKGFRPGKVPYAVVKQQFGQQVHAEAVTDLMQTTFAEAVTQQKLRPAGGPRIEPIATEPGSELRYAAVFEVFPEVSVKALSSAQVERPVATITDEDIDAMLETMRAQRPEFVESTERPAKGDRVTIDYEGRVDGAVNPGTKGSALQVTLGEQRVLPEIEQALLEMTAGESKTIALRFPANYAVQSVVGKEAEFDLKVLKVEQRKLPPIDDSFAQSFGIASGGVAALREEVRLSMEREVTEAARAKQREQLFEQLYRDNPLELPHTMVDEQITELQADMARRLHVHDPRQLPAREAFEQSARRRVALGLLIGEIVRSQELKVDRARVEQRVEAAAATQPNPQEVRRQYLASREIMRQFESAVLEEQAIDWMLSQVKVMDRPSSFRELTGFGKNSQAESQAE